MFRNSDEYMRSLTMVKEMAELKGKIVLGSDWRLACHYNRGESKSQILAKKEKLSPIFFAMNYESKWVCKCPIIWKHIIANLGELISIRCATSV